KGEVIMTQVKLLVSNNENETVKLNELNELNELTDNQLLFNTKESVRVETLSTQAVIKYLAEVNRRRLFLSMGYPSLLAFCMQELKYTETSALRRISAMRLMHQMPEIEQKLEEGKVSLTTLSQLSTFIRKEEK